MARVGGVEMMVVVVMLAMMTPVARAANLLSSLSRGFEKQEEATFTSPRQIDVQDFDVKEYPRKKWVCTLQSGGEGQVAVFLRLFSYIDGANNLNKRLQMGIPVSIEVREGEVSVVMEACFFIPEVEQADPPSPTDPSVSIVTRPAMTVYSRKFGGYATDESTWKKEAAHLKREVEAAGKKVKASQVFWNAYDPPLKIWNRRNEVWLVAQ